MGPGPEARGGRAPRRSIADLHALASNPHPAAAAGQTITWLSFFERSVHKFSALVSAAVCYVAAIAWILVAYGQMGVDASEARPIQGWNLATFFCALICVTGTCFVGVYKLQKIKYRAVAKEVSRMNALLRTGGVDGLKGSDRTGASLNLSPKLDSKIPSLNQAKDAQEEGDIEVYQELLVRKVRAEGVQKGSNLITDAWTFANMRMMTIFLRSFFLADTTDDPGLPELGFIWLYTLALFVLTPTAPSLHHANSRLVL